MKRLGLNRLAASRLGLWLLALAMVAAGCSSASAGGKRTDERPCPALMLADAPSQRNGVIALGLAVRAIGDTREDVRE